MFFKNLVIFSLPDDWRISPAELEEKLKTHTLLPCNQASAQSRGWVAPVAGSGLVYDSGLQMLIALGTESRLLPGAVIRKELDQRGKDLEQKQGFAPGRKQLRDLKDQVVTELLPKAFIRDKVSRAWIDLERHRIVVDSTTAKAAEELMTVLRNDLGSLEAVPLSVKDTTANVLQAWLLAADVPGEIFDLEHDCELVGLGQEAVRYVSHALDTAEIRAQVAQGKSCSRIGLLWRDRVHLVLTSGLQIKRLAPAAISAEPAVEKAADEKLDFEATFTLMCGEYGLLISELVALFGGLAEEEKPKEELPEAA